MRNALRRLDALLRGNLNRRGEPTSTEVDFPLVQIIGVTIVLAAIYGACIGTFTCVSAKSPTDGWLQLLASSVKAPFLFYLTLFVTFPSLYVFNALMGSRLNILAALRLMVASIAVLMAILASLGPIIVFFAFSTPGGHLGYRFILLLVVGVSGMAGLLGLNYLLRMLNRHCNALPPSTMGQATQGSEVVAEISDEPSAGRSVPPRVRVASESQRQSVSSLIFRVWVFVFAVVGMQMSWVLRPFIGSPNQPFTWFREREGNFFQSVFRLIWQILSGN